MEIAKRQDFSKIFNSNGDTGKTFNSIFSMPNQKDRKFAGSTTKRGHGPVFDPTNPAFKTMDSALTDGGDGGADAGGAMGESTNEKFIGLLEALRNENNSTQIDLICKGFNAINESSIDDITDLDSPDEIEDAFYGYDDEETNDQYDERVKRLQPIINEMCELVKEHGYWSKPVAEYSANMPVDASADMETIHHFAKNTVR